MLDRNQMIVSKGSLLLLPSTERRESLSRNRFFLRVLCKTADYSGYFRTLSVTNLVVDFRTFLAEKWNSYLWDLNLRECSQIRVFN